MPFDFASIPPRTTDTGRQPPQTPSAPASAVEEGESGAPHAAVFVVFALVVLVAAWWLTGTPPDAVNARRRPTPTDGRSLFTWALEY